MKITKIDTYGAAGGLEHRALITADLTIEGCDTVVSAGFLLGASADLQTALEGVLTWVGRVPRASEMAEYTSARHAMIEALIKSRMPLGPVEQIGSDLETNALSAEV
jgi:hypothetical protein